ncbi:hypothetical protein [Marinimicrobium agarilyticum]|uniref:hypothetical protein n=1 Tax=Marinimicrobium agarilyticum TaxID=306546 RepID=UPI0004144134|nr:hypothetical protein [Marinimicrobium agarilyticum]
MTPLSQLRPHWPALSASALVLVLGLLGALLHGFTSLENQRQQLDAFGQTLAHSAAQRAVDATLRQDMISLQVVLQELNRHPQVVGATIHDVENNLLVQSGFAPADAEGERFQRYAAPIALADNIAGHLHIAVTTPSLTGADLRFFWMWGLAVLLVASLPWLIPHRLLPFRNATSSAFVSPVRGEETWEEDDANTADRPQNPDYDPEAGLTEIRLRLQLTNLNTLHGQLNQDSFDRQLRQFDRQLQGVLSLYGGRKVALTDDTLLIDYRGESHSDCAFRALCSAQLLGELSHLNSGPKLKIQARIHPITTDTPVTLSDAYRDQLSEVPPAVQGIEIAPSLIDDELQQHLELDPSNGLLIGVKAPYRQLLNKQQQQLQHLGDDATAERH